MKERMTFEEAVERQPDSAIFAMPDGDYTKAELIEAIHLNWWNEAEPNPMVEYNPFNRTITNGIVNIAIHLID